jgi:hypothetical protein
VTRRGQIVLGLGYAGLWGMVLVALLASYGYVQHGDELAQAAAERQTMARAAVDLAEQSAAGGGP